MDFTNKSQRRLYNLIFRESIMKKILFVLFTVISTATFAVEKDCSGFSSDQAQATVVQKVQAKGVKSLTINYSADLAKQATDLQSKLQAAGVNVTATQVDGNATCEMTNFAK